MLANSLITNYLHTFLRGGFFIRIIVSSHPNKSPTDFTDSHRDYACIRAIRVITSFRQWVFDKSRIQKI